MDWMRQIDAYCERLGPGLWAEPLNAVSNAAFLLAAYVLWQRARGQGLAPVATLIGVLLVIGLASALWHTVARAYAGALDSLSILAFILVYLYAANRYFFGLSRILALIATAAFVPYTAALGWGFARMPFFSISAEYWPVALLILVAAFYLRRHVAATARGLALGGGLLAVSISLRSLDAALCDVWPTGTHYLWHCLNAVMLGWMIEVLRRHLLARAMARR